MIDSLQIIRIMSPKDTYISRAFLILLVMVVFSLVYADGDRLQNNTFVIDWFDNRIGNSVSSQNISLKLHGGASIEKTERGSTLKLTSNGWAEYVPPVKIGTEEGSFSFWLKPLWKDTDESSKTFVSLRWDDTKNSYFAISQGWWEPTGAGRLYFILSNQDYLHCSLPYRFIPGYRAFITASWRSGKDGFCRIYVDGEMVAEKRKSFSAIHHLRGPIFFGSDRGATDQRGRSAESLIDTVTIQDRALSNHEVLQLYNTKLENTVARSEKKWKWLNDGLNLPLISKRTKDGTLLETRAIFDEDIRWATSREETDKILERINKAGFNVYIPCVWHGKGTYFSSSLARPDPRLKGRIESGDDPLTYLVNRAHGLGIQVHPWFTVVNRETDEYVKFFDNGTPERAFNVHNSEFRNFIVDLMVDVVRRYEVDGINLDYIRAMGICTSYFCRKDYEDRSGHEFWSDYALRGIHGEARNRLQEWQDNSIANIVKPFFFQAKKIRSKLVISVDGHPETKDKTRPLEGRDEISWVNKGWVDIIFAMDYRERVDYENIDKLRMELKDRDKLIIVFGNYDKRDGKVIPRSGDLVAKYADFSRRKWPGSGVAFYLYGQMTDEQIKALRDTPFHSKTSPFFKVY